MGGRISKPVGAIDNMAPNSRIKPDAPPKPVAKPTMTAEQLAKLKDEYVKAQKIYDDALKEWKALQKTADDTGTKVAKDAAAKSKTKTMAKYAVYAAAAGAIGYVAVDALGDYADDGNSGGMGDLFGGNVFTSQNMWLSASCSCSSMLFAGAVFFIMSQKKA